MSAIAEFMTVGKPSWGDQTSEQVRKALQGADARGITSPDRIRSWLDAQARASQVEGGQDFSAADMRTAIRFGRSALKGQSDRFMATILPGLAVDMGAAQSGTGIQSLYSGLVGGTQKTAALEFQRRHGLRDKSGRLVGQDKFTHDLDQWIDETLIPRMSKGWRKSRRHGSYRRVRDEDGLKPHRRRRRHEPRSSARAALEKGQAVSAGQRVLPAPTSSICVTSAPPLRA